MKKNIPTSLVDEYLQSLAGIKEAETDPFFYTRLKARMEKERSTEWKLPLQPAWLVSILALFVFINSFFLVTGRQSRETSSQSTSLQNFASGYDLSVSTPY